MFIKTKNHTQQNGCGLFFRSYNVSFFAALCLFLSAVEYAIPKPLPFLRLGLANLPVLIAAKKFNVKEYIVLVILKILGQALLSGTLFSYVFVFSFAGSAASAILMYLVWILCKVNNSSGKNISNIGLSLCGALGNNAAQIVCSRFIMFGENTKYIAPLLLCSGFVTGLLLGVFSLFFEEKSVWLKEKVCENIGKNVLVDKNCGNVENFVKSGKTCGNLSGKNGKEIIWFITGFILMLCFLFIQSVPIIWGCVVVFYIIALIRRKGKVKLLPSLFITLSVTIFALISPFGKVLFTVGKLRITEGALLSGLHRSGILVGMVFLSQIIVNKRVQFPGKTGTFIAKIFEILDDLGQKRIKFEKGTVISSIDSRLCEIWEEKK